MTERKRKADYTPEEWAAHLAAGREHDRKYRAANPEKVRERNRNYSAANPEKVRESSRKYREANPEKKRESNRKHKYGITPQQFEDLVAAQEGKCFVCQRSGVKLFVDHCHDGGHVRALLCSNCNTAEGHLAKTGVDPELIAKRLKQLRDSENYPARVLEIF